MNPFHNILVTTSPSKVNRHEINENTDSNVLIQNKVASGKNNFSKNKSRVSVGIEAKKNSSLLHKNSTKSKKVATSNKDNVSAQLDAGDSTTILKDKVSAIGENTELYDLINRLRKYVTTSNEMQIINMIIDKDDKGDKDDKDDKDDKCEKEVESKFKVDSNITLSTPENKENQLVLSPCTSAFVTSYNNRLSEIPGGRNLPTRYSLGIKRFSLPGRMSFGVPQAERGTKKISNGKIDSSNFLHFCVTGVSSEVLNGKVKLNPFNVYLPAQVIETFPSNNCHGSNLPDNISDYCFPTGVYHEPVCKKSVDKITGPSNDKFHIIQFSDAKGKVTYGCCVTTTEVVPTTRDILVKAVKNKLSYNLAGVKINKFVNKYRCRVRKAKLLNIKGNDSLKFCNTPANNKNISDKSNSIVARLKKSWSMSKNPVTPSQNNKSDKTMMTTLFERFATPHEKNIEDSTQSKVYGAKYNFQEMANNANNDPVVSEYLRLVQWCSDDDCDSDTSEEITPIKNNTHKIVGTKNETSDMISQCVFDKTLDLEISNIDIDDYVIITQRCYCMLSDNPNHTLLFKLLLGIANKERLQGDENVQLNVTKYHDESDRCKDKSDNSCSKISETIFLNRRHRRHEFLHHVKCLRVLNNAVVSFPSYIKSLRIDNKMTTLDEFVCGVLFSVVPTADIMNILSLLLTEKSIIVYGTDAGLTTSIATALLFLLHPFNWEGIFVPITPVSAHEIMQAPVPFIVGTVHRPNPKVIASSVGILYIDDYLSNTSPHGYLKSYFKLPESDLDPSKYCDPSKTHAYRELCTKVSKLSKRLNVISDELNYNQKPRQNQLTIRSASIRMATFLYRMHQDEKKIVNDILNLIHGYNKKLCGDLTNPTGWRSYGAMNSSTGEFEFYPQWFMEPLELQVQFQEQVIHTQMFVSFMDKQRIAYTSKAAYRQFIGDWLSYRMKLRKKTLL